MGAALLKGWIAQGIGPIVVVEPNPSRRNAQGWRKARRIIAVSPTPSQVPARAFAPASSRSSRKS